MTLHRAIVIALCTVAVCLCACERIHDDRIPPSAVRIAFNNEGEWAVYGVGGAGIYRYFIKNQQEPPGFPYTALSYTGYGGVLLIGDIHGTPVAYDLSCPVECKPNIRIHVLADELKAECSTCHSVYDIVTNYGQPISGPAAKHHYGLRKYYVGPGFNGEYMVVSR